MQGGAFEGVLIKPLKSYLMREDASTTCLDAAMTPSKNLGRSTFLWSTQGKLMQIV
jgi:hypothetical protein